MSRDVPPGSGRTRPPTVLRGGPALDVALHVAFALLAVASAVRYVQGHGVDAGTIWVLTGGAALVALYAVVVVAVRRRSSLAPAWSLLLVATWVPLNLLAPSFSWLAVALAFVVLRTLPFRWACGVIAVLVATVVVGWSRIADGLDPTVAVGPMAIAVLAVLAYRSLDHEATERQQLLDELREAQGELADAQYRTGVAAERARLSRDLHDSVAQDLSSINLLLLATSQDWTRRPEAAQRHVEQAARTARDALEEVRRVVADRAPSAAPGGLVDDLQNLATETARSTGVDVEVRVVGDVVDPGAEAGTALVRSTRGLLANVAEHAAAARVVLTVTFHADAVSVDVLDDGRGFPPGRASDAGMRGHGLEGIRERVAALGGRLDVESAPGNGTAAAVTVPLGREDGPRA
jgi:signal transduction histidine kinase